MSERFPDEVLRRVQQAYDSAFIEVSRGMRLDEVDTTACKVAGYAAMRAVLEEYLGKACTDNPLQNQLLDLITLMPDSQTQEIVDYILSLREIRAGHRAASDGSPR